MALSTGFRPRPAAERLALARELAALAPGAEVPIRSTDEAEKAVWARLFGLVPSWAGEGDPGPLGEPLLVPEKAPLVSILICTYNRAGLLPDAIASARAQSWPVEILVVDDGSRDGTQELLARTPGIRAFRQEPNQGKPAALNRGLSEARGDALLVLDDDDRLLPGAVGLLARALFAHPELVAVIADSLAFDGESGEIRRILPALRLPGPLAFPASLAQVPALPGGTLVRMSAQRQAGLYDTRINMLEDMDMFLRLAELGPIEALPLPVHLYRLHDAARGGATDARRASDDPFLFQKERIERARPVFKQRWQERQPVEDRTTSHFWALGLKLRGLHEEAIEEARRWNPPFDARESWIRQRVGLPAPAPERGEKLVVVHDGDPGALPALLLRQARGRALQVFLAVPEEPLDPTRLWWPGDYEPPGEIARRLHAPGPWHLRLSSDPEWAPPSIDDPALLPLLPDADPAAVLSTGAALGWPPPERRRPGLPEPDHPVLRAVRLARRLGSEGDPGRALGLLTPLLSALPAWKAAWRMAAEMAVLMGRLDEARAFAARGR